VSDFQRQYQGNYSLQNADADGMTLDEMEYIAIQKAYEKYHGNVSQMASALGLSRQALYRRMKKYQLE
jgi:two-component system NtrC family response regulator